MICPICHRGVSSAEVVACKTCGKSGCKNCISITLNLFDIPGIIRVTGDIDDQPFDTPGIRPRTTGDWFCSVECMEKYYKKNEDDPLENSQKG